jgi:hypothetical protein
MGIGVISNPLVAGSNPAGRASLSINRGWVYVGPVNVGRRLILGQQ